WVHDERDGLAREDGRTAPPAAASPRRAPARRARLGRDPRSPRPRSAASFDSLGRLGEERLLLEERPERLRFEQAAPAASLELELAEDRSPRLAPFVRAG